MGEHRSFRSAHLIADAPLRVSVEPFSDGWVIVADASGGQRRMQLRHRHRINPLPPVLDAVAFCALPLAMRARQALHVDGPLTRGALRNLREIAEAWANWNPARFAAVEVSCASVADDRPPPGLSCIAAWSGDLRSTVAAAGGDETLTAAGWRPDVAVHVTGLGHPMPDAAAVARVGDAFRAAGVDLVIVDTDAAEEGFLDPVTGALPIVAAALHLVGDGRAALAVHAEAWPMRGQLIRPRRRPTTADLFSGDRMAVRSVGGTDPLPRMARWLAGRPGLAPLVAGCRATGFAAPRCARCGDCRRLDLGRLGSGLGGGGARIDLDDPDMEAEAILAHADWSGLRLRKWRLSLGLIRAEVRRAARDRDLWRRALRGEADPWPQ